MSKLPAVGDLMICFTGRVGGYVGLLTKIETRANSYRVFGESYTIEWKKVGEPDYSFESSYHLDQIEQWRV